MTLVAHYDLELHLMDVKTAFLNRDLEENVYMAQPKGFTVEEKQCMVCHLKKSIYGLKQASRQWYLKFDSTIRKFGFQENIEDNCVYTKFKNGKYIFLVLYVDDILLASSDVNLLLQTKFLSSKFDMKDLGEASFVLGIEIHRDREKGGLGFLSVFSDHRRVNLYLRVWFGWCAQRTQWFILVRVERPYV